MVGASACLWSICTGLTFLASGFGTLFGLRPGLGIGEAGAHPACTRGHPNICRHRTAFGYQLDGGLPQHVRIGRRPAEPRTDQQRPAPRSGHRRTGLLRPERPEPRRGGGCADDPRRRGRAPRSHPHEARPGPGVPTVVPVEPNPARHAIARASGADAVPAPSGDIADRIRDIAPEGIDVVIMAIGRPEALTPYLGILAPGARVSVFAGFNSEATLRFVANGIHDNEYKIVGASSCRLENFQRIAPMIDSGRLVVKDLIGTQLPLERAADAIRLAASGSDMRVGVDVRARQSTSPTSTSTRPTTPPWPRFATP